MKEKSDLTSVSCEMCVDVMWKIMREKEEKLKEIFIIEKKYYCDLDEWRKYAQEEDMRKEELLNMKMKVISLDSRVQTGVHLDYVKILYYILPFYTFCVRGAS
jgi:DNA mismatch repair ATPase MutS